MNGDAYSRSSRGPSSRDHHGGSRDDRRGDANSGRDRERDRERDGARHRDDGHERTRRRSRSPGSSRRDYGNGDSYSSSRGYREREREDRFGDRGGRSDRDRSDRDRGAYGRRDDRRADPYARRDRDMMDDRRGGGAGGRDGGYGGRSRGDRDPFAQNRRSPSPVKKKEPTPDLTDVVSVLDMKRRLTQWDIKPEGYEKVTAEQAKMSGMFPLPGAPRQTPMDPTKLQAFIDQPSSSVNATALAPTHSRQSKRLVVTGFASTVNNDLLRDFFNLHMNGINISKGVDPCITAQLSPDRSYALVEFRASEDATYALTLSGVFMEAAQHSNGDVKPAALEIRRPKGYIAPAALAADAVAVKPDPAAQLTTSVPDSPYKIAITGIPTFIEGDDVQGIFVVYGPLKSFVLVKDSGSDQSRGTAFCEFADQSGDVTQKAIEQLNGIELAEFKIRVSLACQGEQQVETDNSVSGMRILAGQQQASNITRVLCFLNMVTGDELVDDDEYEEIVSDIREECEKFGTVLDIHIPRPQAAGRSAPGVGKIYLKYETVDAATKALTSLAGRNFAGRTVVATYYSEELFDVGAW